MFDIPNNQLLYEYWNANILKDLGRDIWLILKKALNIICVFKIFCCPYDPFITIWLVLGPAKDLLQPGATFDLLGTTASNKWTVLKEVVLGLKLKQLLIRSFKNLCPNVQNSYASGIFNTDTRIKCLLGYALTFFLPQGSPGQYKNSIYTV